MKREENGIPVETERKWLIKMPSETALLALGAERDDIVQTYLRGVGSARVRQRKRADGTRLYTYTKKTALSQLSSVEEEREIDENEYRRLLGEADGRLSPIVKVRYTLPYGTHRLEIDVYPFWRRVAVLEIELPSEDAPVTLPPFLEVLREVSGDRRLKNRALAECIPDENSL